MKCITSLLVCFFALIAASQLSSANSTSTTTDSFLSHQYSTPEQTWEIFKASILTGDYDTAKKCCCTGKTKCVLRFEKMDDEKRKNLVQSMQPIKKVELQEHKAKYEVVRDINGVAFSTFVYFEKVAEGWKIANY